MRFQRLFSAFLGLALTASVAPAASISYLGGYNLRAGNGTTIAFADFQPIGSGVASGRFYSQGTPGDASLGRERLIENPISAPVFSMAGEPQIVDLTLELDSIGSPSFNNGIGDFSNVSGGFTLNGTAVSAGAWLSTITRNNGETFARVTAEGGGDLRLFASNFATTSNINLVGITYHEGRGTLFALDVNGDITELTTAGAEVATYSANGEASLPALTFGTGSSVDTGDIEYVRNEIGGETFEALLIVGEGGNLIRRLELDGTTADFTDFALPTSTVGDPGFAGNATGIGVDAVNDVTYITSTNGNVYAYGSVVATAVPEPGSFAVIACLGVAGAVRQRRRKKAKTA